MVVYPEGYKESEGTAASDEDEDSEKDDRYPKITAEDWKARERARKLLRNILTRQVEACEAQRKALLKESLAGPSPYELAAEIAPSPCRCLADAPNARCQHAGSPAAHQPAAETPSAREPKLEAAEAGDDGVQATMYQKIKALNGEVDNMCKNVCV